MMICYIEITNINTVESMTIQNTILFDVLEDQQNIIHAKINNQRESVMLIKEKAQTNVINKEHISVYLWNKMAVTLFRA